MVAIIAPISQVASPRLLTAQAAALGYPATLSGFIPAQRGYWQEPGLPWWTEAQHDNPPLDFRGNPSLCYTAWIEGDSMAPRFPAGAGVKLMAVGERQRLVLGKVYTYAYRNEATGMVEMTLGRLVAIGSNYLEVAADNPQPGEADRTRWPLRDNEEQAVWDVREVTHYVSYPGGNESLPASAA